MYTKLFVSKIAVNTDHDDTWYIINPHGRFLLARGDRKRPSYISVSSLGINVHRIDERDDATRREEIREAREDAEERKTSLFIFFRTAELREKLFDVVLTSGPFN